MSLRVEVDLRTAWANAVVGEAALDGVIEHTEAVKSLSDRYVPIWAGDVILSGDTDIEGTITMSSGAVSYSHASAVAAHENMHDHYRNGRRAKFLETAYTELAASFAPTVAGRIRRVLGK